MKKFEDLPNLVEQLCEKVDRLEKAILDKKTEPASEPDRWMDLTELCEYIPDKPQKATVYGWVSKGLIPCNRGQKRLRFLKSEIDEWLKLGRKKTVLEIQQEAKSYIDKRQGGYHGR